MKVQDVELCNKHDKPIKVPLIFYPSALLDSLVDGGESLTFSCGPMPLLRYSEYTRRRGRVTKSQKWLECPPRK